MAAAAGRPLGVARAHAGATCLHAGPPRLAAAAHHQPQTLGRAGRGGGQEAGQDRRQVGRSVPRCVLRARSANTNIE